MIGHDIAGRPAGLLGTAATAAVALLPKLTCPVCWPAYSAVLSAMGLGFVDYTPYLLPLTAFFVAVMLAALAWTARVQRTLLPLLAGVLAGAILLIGRFVLENDAVTYVAIALLVVAPFLPRLRRVRAACPDCVSEPAKENT